MKITWDDIGRATDAGVYEVDGDPVNVSWSDIEIWQKNPQAVFKAKWHAAGLNRGGMYMLGTYEE